MKSNVAQVNYNENIAEHVSSLFIMHEVSEAKQAVRQNQERAVVKHFKCMRLFRFKWPALECVDGGKEIHKM